MQIGRQEAADKTKLMMKLLGLETQPADNHTPFAHPRGYRPTATPTNTRQTRNRRGTQQDLADKQKQTQQT